MSNLLHRHAWFIAISTTIILTSIALTIAAPKESKESIQGPPEFSLMEKEAVDITRRAWKNRSSKPSIEQLGYPMNMGEYRNEEGWYQLAWAPDGTWVTVWATTHNTYGPGAVRFVVIGSSIGLSTNRSYTTDWNVTLKMEN